MGTVTIKNVKTGQSIVVGSANVVDKGDYVVVIPIGIELYRRVCHKNTFQVDLS